MKRIILFLFLNIHRLTLLQIYSVRARDFSVNRKTACWYTGEVRGKIQTSIKRTARSHEGHVQKAGGGPLVQKQLNRWRSFCALYTECHLIARKGMKGYSARTWVLWGDWSCFSASSTARKVEVSTAIRRHLSTE